MILHYSIVGLGVLLSTLYIIHRLRKEWQGHSIGCSQCPLKKMING